MPSGPIHLEATGFTDEPMVGRFDGENSNFGLVNTDDTPWQTLVDRITEVHKEAPQFMVKTE